MRLMKTRHANGNTEGWRLFKGMMAVMEYRMSRYVPDELAFGQSYL